MYKSLIVLFGIFLIQNAYAENEFTFKVPVSLQNVTYQSGTVTCRLTPLNSSGLIALGRTNISRVPDNLANQTRLVTVKVSTSRPEAVGRYTCFLTLATGDSQFVYGSNGTDRFMNEYRAAMNADLVTADVLVTGTIPPEANAQ